MTWNEWRTILWRQEGKTDVKRENEKRVNNMILEKI
jgi:hypothetical protein